ncbi:hypothetical protein ACIO3O_37250 [Streptomyces sp. NPDC087440]|uniref:hypothetical protein n=1 Tax=Streptomyces sp. NPDC087440 TaxID=3365790 RepID=UPI0038113B1F
MRDGDWQFAYSASAPYPGCLLDFGRTPSGIYLLKEPETKFADLDDTTTPLPGEDGVRMGRDYQRTVTVALELGVDTVDAPTTSYNYLYPAGGDSGQIGVGGPQASAGRPTLVRRAQWNEEAVGIVRTAWRADAVRRRAGGVAWLRRQSAGRVRLLYGRPRKFAVVHEKFSDQGFTPLLVDFEAVDDKFYDNDEQRAELVGRANVPGPVWRPGRPGTPAGGTGERLVAGLNVGGRLATHPWITFHGPGRNYVLTIDGLWTVQLNVDLAVGQSVRLDSRSWSRAVWNIQTGGSVADKLTRSSPLLRDLLLHPGRHTARMQFSRRPGLTFVGPRIEIGWRNAHAWW